MAIVSCFLLWWLQTLHFNQTIEHYFDQGCDGDYGDTHGRWLALVGGDRGRCEKKLHVLSAYESRPHHNCGRKLQLFTMI